jgi:ribosomal protein L27
MDVDGSEDNEEVSDAGADENSDDEILVPRKRPAKASRKTPAANKNGRTSVPRTAGQQSPSGENVDTGNCAMRTPTVVGKPTGSGAVSTGKVRDATPRTGQLFGRLSTGAGAADLTPGGMHS